MDQTQHQSHHGMQEEQMATGPFFYSGDDNSYNHLGYSPYNQVQHAPQTRHLDLHHAGMQGYQGGLSFPYAHPSNAFSGSAPQGALAVSATPPESPDLSMYEQALSPPQSGSDTSGEGLYHHSNSSGPNSPISSRSNSLVHRTPRSHPTPSPTSSINRPRSRSRDSDSDEPYKHRMGALPNYGVENPAFTRKEATRKQRIEAEQRRRDELRDGYARLKEVLPLSNQKSSKVSLLERGESSTNHIIYLEKHNRSLEEKIAELEADAARLRGVSERISLNSAGNTPSPSHTAARALTPSADSQPLAHSLTLVQGQQPPSEHSSPSASENGRAL